MPTKAPKATRARGGTEEINFEYFAPKAKQVILAGTFNNWNESELKLKKDRNGSWKVSVPLAPGHHEYRYIVDGVWQNDQRPVRCVPNDVGSFNCVIEVSKKG